MLHCHLDYLAVLAVQPSATPFLTTLHGRLDLPELRRDLRLFPEVPLVSISDAQRLRCRVPTLSSTVHHGLPPDLLTPRPMTRRVSGVPWPHLPGETRRTARSAIARGAGMPLKIAAKVDRVDEAYFEDDDPSR